MLRQVLAIALLTASGAAIAQPNSEAADKAKDPNRKICEKVEVTGSRLGATRVCMTQQQWRDQRRASRDDLERAQQGAVIRPSS